MKMFNIESIEKASSRAFQGLWVEFHFERRVTLFVVSFIGSTTLLRALRHTLKNL